MAYDLSEYAMYLLIGELPWLMQHRVLADEELRRDLRRWVPEYQTTMPPKLQGVQSVRHG